MSFFNELKRRNVFRVGIVYTITAWLIVRVAGLVAGMGDENDLHAADTGFACIAGA